ncbi:LLM class flavin-dependent oxidoreductase [Rhodococcus sp. IEGM 1330]|uniref:LLM class flavin-dependent oxidoreductase n=1 Tax=Rhodococcus sp. IEGM 1330 TaxID=3082225 RepID=UPI00295521AE|nr:LLM class flavin-dependent oxidoreductase [Rhodococcus sp. IEGM 1330]MDV8023044.1 LLM class flavin-dependent oxidoreductase [Rhodococcus sp. IEGM 1330]
MDSDGTNDTEPPVKLSLIVGRAPDAPADLLPFAELASSFETTLWTGQANLGSAASMFAYAAGAGRSSAVGFSVALMGMRPASTAALEVIAHAQLSRQPVAFGVGPGSIEYQESWLGHRLSKPIQATRQYVEEFRAHTDRVRTQIEGRGTHLPGIEIGVGVLRPAMAEMVGEAADFAVTWLCPPQYLRDVVVPAMKRGAQRLGRPVPRLVAVNPLFASGQGIAAHVLVESPHLSMPHYLDMLRRAGLKVGDDRQRNSEVLAASTAVLDAESSRLSRLLNSYRSAGVDELVLNASGMQAYFGTAAACGAVRTVLEHHQEDLDE